MTPRRGHTTRATVSPSVYRSGTRRYTHSFPTRRSSDLKLARIHQLVIGKNRFKAPSFILIVQHHDWNDAQVRSEEHTSELQSRGHLVCRLLLEKKKESTAAGV